MLSAAQGVVAASRQDSASSAPMGDEVEPRREFSRAEARRAFSRAEALNASNAAFRVGGLSGPRRT